MAALFAILSAFLYALSNVITQVGLRYSSMRSGVLISLISCFIFVAFYSLFFTSMHEYLNTGVLFFLAAGIVGPFFGRIFLYLSIKKVGTAVASTIYEVKPLFSVIAALFFLNEFMTLAVFSGMFLMMAGTAIVSLEKSGGQLNRKWTQKDLLLPIVSGACYGIAHALRKGGLNLVPSPTVGVMVQNIGAMVFVPFIVLSGSNRKRHLQIGQKGWILFGIVGLLQVLAQWCLFKALEVGKVVVVSPLSSLSTFFVLLLTALFLRRHEKVTSKIVLGAALILAATLVLTLKT
jgi:drug/metabolite transporter (DMT)-like permease